MLKYSREFTFSSLKLQIDFKAEPFSFRTTDFTTDFIGRTAYAEYLYKGFEGHRVGPYGDRSGITFAEYDGYLRSVREENIFNPASGARLYFEDCQNGYVCNRTRWREDENEQGKWNDPESRYLQAAWNDVDFIKNTSPYHATEYHWTILCENNSFEICFISSRYYQNS